VSEPVLLPLASGRLETLDLAGDEARAPIVLLHGGLSSLGLWRGLPERIAAATGRRVVAFSRFGHGASDPPPRASTTTFMHDAARDLLPEVFARLGIERPVLVGHSDGASIALLYAAERDVEALALLAPHVFVEEHTLRGIRAAREDFENGRLREGLARHHRDPDVAFHEWGDVWLDPAFRAWNIEDAAERTSAPTLLVQGTEDEYGTLAQLDAIERRLRGPVTRLHVSGDHFPHWRHPEAVEAAIATLIA
jgi:pimeloyl-ACP methyl ester carboxylesterase